MVSVSMSTTKAAVNFKPVKEEDLVSDIAKLRIKSMPLNQELKELEAVVLKTPPIWARISDLRDQIRDIQQEINQKQTLLEQIQAEKDRAADRTGGKDPVDAAEEKQAEKNPYARIFKTDVSVLADAEHKLNEDPLMVLTKKGPSTAMDEPTVAAALLVEREEAALPSEAATTSAGSPAAALLAPSGETEDDDGTSGATQRRDETAADAAAPAEKRRRSLMERLEEAEGR